MTLREDPCLREMDINLTPSFHLHAVECGPEEGFPILFLHGYSDSVNAFSEIMRAPFPGCRLIALDLRGHGGSSKPEEGYGIGSHVGDVLGFMDQAKIAKAVIIGHSLGSLITERLAADYPERVAGIVLLGSTSSVVGNKVLGGMADEVDALSDPVDPAFVRAFQMPSFSVPAPFMEAIMQASLKIPSFVWGKALRGVLEVDHTDLLPRIACPTLILWGRHDGIFGAEDQDKLRAGIPASSFEIFEGDHVFHWELPSEVTASLQRFVAPLLNLHMPERDHAETYRP